MRLVVLDTTHLYQDPFLKASEFKAVVKCGWEVAIPRVVVEETRRHFIRQARKFNAEVGALKKFAPIVTVDLSRVDEETGRDNYENELRQRLNQLNGRILDLPEVKHKVLMQQDLGDRKPFSGGRGYRDALIWHTVVELAKRQQVPIIFVSANTKDFTGGKARLHPDLIASLEQCGLGPNAVTCERSLGSVYENHLKQLLSPPAAIQGQLAAGNLPNFDLGTWLTQQFVVHVAGQEFVSADLGFPEEYETCHMVEVETVNSVDVSSVRLTAPGNVLVSVSAEVRARFDVFIFKPDYWGMDDNHTPVVTDHDWNDHYLMAEDSAQVSLTLLLALDLSGPEVKECSVIDVSS